MKTRRLGPFDVSALGLGCMALSYGYGVAPPLAAAERLLLRAVELGVTLFDTAALYGFGANEELLGRVLAPHRPRCIIASKCGIFRDPDGKRAIDGRPEALKRTCEDSLRRLRTDVIDLYYLHRWDKRVPIEESIGALADLVREGKVRAIGVSEVSTAKLREAQAVHPISALQNEYSLWTRNAELGALQACRDVDAAFVAFSPSARAFLTGTLRDPAAQLPANDLRRNMPRFQAEAYAANLRLLDGYAALAREAGCTMAQLALAWLLARGEHIIPLTGTTNVSHLEENVAAADVTLTSDLVARLDALINEHTVVGRRYADSTLREIDTEEF
jgi:aryl-alcohol dehydrogenase-like predicted oxidoreductase